jgi:prepilin-type N-terminal cleavage/methylation domain-containing protein
MFSEGTDMRQREGFTLVELLIVVLIISTLSSIVVPRLLSFRDRGFRATMQSDLRNLASFEESFFNDVGGYSEHLAEVAELGFQHSARVTITIVEASASGWSATATHSATDTACALYVGSALPVGPATEQGMVACQ